MSDQVNQEVGKIKELKRADDTLNRNIIEWLNQNLNEIGQIMVIVTWKGQTIFSSRSSMNNMEKLWFMEQLKSNMLR